jgi:hypothetical protein
MEASDLQKILLIQAVEETDRSDEVLPSAERLGATRSALGAEEPPPAPLGTPLPPAAEGFLARRAQMLLGRLRARAPAVGRLLAVLDGSTWHERVLLVLAFAAGLLWPLLAGQQRISLFAFPLLALLAWNLCVYGLLIGRALMKRGDGWLFQFWLGKLYLRWVRQETQAILAQSTRFNVPLATGLTRFAATWWASAQELFELRARWLLHLCAALAGVGLALGYYCAAGALHHPAGWSGQAVGTGTARALLAALYGPASAITGIAIPQADALGDLRWQGGGGGGDAVAWAHLIAVTAALYVIAPRLIAAAASTFARWRRSRALAVPDGLSAYARGLLEGVTAA